MPEFNIPNLCGASANLNSVDKIFDDLIDQVFSDIEADASAMVSNLTNGLVDLDLNLSSLMRNGIPSLPDINLQAEITSLFGLSGIQANISRAALFSKFGKALTSNGKDLATLLAGAALLLAGGKDICDLVPNMVAAADGLSDPVIKANNVTQPEGEVAKETFSEVVTPVAAINLVNAAMTSRASKSTDLVTALFSKLNTPLGSSGRTTSASRLTFREADIKIRDGLNSAGIALSPAVNWLNDIAEKNSKLDDAEGTSKPLITLTEEAKKEQTYERNITSASTLLKNSLNKFQEQWNQSQKTYPDNSTDDGKKVFYSTNEAEYNQYTDQIKKDNNMFRALMEGAADNQKAIKSDITNKHFTTYISETKALDTAVKQRNEDFKEKYTRPVKSEDKEKSKGEDIQVKESSTPSVKRGPIESNKGPSLATIKRRENFKKKMETKLFKMTRKEQEIFFRNEDVGWLDSPIEIIRSVSEHDSGLMEFVGVTKGGRTIGPEFWPVHHITMMPKF